MIRFANLRNNNNYFDNKTGKGNIENEKINILNGHHNFFLIGIGGAGMSAIALILKGLGAEVSGSDLKESRYTNILKDEDIQVYIGHNPKNIKNADAVVYSTAIDSSNVELIYASQRNIPIFTRGEVLSWIINSKKGIAVTGTHGKTTTTSMISLMLNKLDLDPIILIGGELNELGSNARFGRGDFVVAESCESDGTFLKYKPFIGVVTNIEDDHLDHWGNFEKLKLGFLDFLKNIKKNGFAVINGDDKNLLSFLKEVKNINNINNKEDINNLSNLSEYYESKIGKKTITFGLEKYNIVTAEEIKLSNFSSKYKLLIKNPKDNSIFYKNTVMLNVPGVHNIMNSLAALSVIYGLGLDLTKAIEILGYFTGTKRRFEKRGEKKGAVFFDDYAHHPTEVAATLKTAELEKKSGRIIVVFQPHRYTRLLNLHEKFSKSFDGCDVLIISDVFGSDEKPICGVTGKLLIDSLIENGFKNNLAYIPKISDIKDYLMDVIKPDDIVLIMGAGDITRVTEDVLKE